MKKIYHQHPPYSDNQPVWPSPPSMEAILRWEAVNSVLPDDYKSFMKSYNGGTVYPLEFYNNIDHNLANEHDIETLVGIDILFDWDTFLEKNATRSSDWSRKMLAIGYDTTSSVIGISIEPEIYGTIVYWWRNSEGWDEDDDGPLPFGIVADNFRQLILEKLFISEDGGHPRWQLPNDLSRANVIEF